MFGVKSRNIPVIFVTDVTSGLLFFLPILALYFQEHLFSVANVALIFAVSAISLAVFEFPTGAISDLFGRRNTIVLAHCSQFLAVLSLLGTSLVWFILYAVLNALARALCSGTDSAIIYDTLKAERKEKKYKKIVGIHYALWPLGATIGSIVGGHLAAVSLSLTILASLVPVAVSLLLNFLFLEEPKYEKEGHRNVLRHMRECAGIIVRNRQLMILCVAGGFLMWGLGETVHHLAPLFFAFKEIPLVYFGYLSAVSFGFSSLGHYMSHDVSAWLGDKTTTVLTALATPVLLLLATFTAKFTSMLFFLLPSLSFGLRNPVVNHLLNLEVGSSKRATVLSAFSLSGELGLAIFAPFIGWYADLYTINTAFKLCGLLFFVVPVAFLFLKR